MYIETILEFKIFLSTSNTGTPLHHFVENNGSTVDFFFYSAYRFSPHIRVMYTSGDDL